MAFGLSADFLTGAVLADTMPSALDALAARAGADGAVLVRSRADIPIGAVASPQIVEPVTAYIAGDRPDDPRIAGVHPSLSEGFRLDQDDFSLRQIARDPYYQEFLKPRGFGWHACALLGEEPNGEQVHISIKRRLDRGPFARNDLALVEHELPTIRAALKFIQPLEPVAFGFGRSLIATERFIVGFNERGEAFDLNGMIAGSDTLKLERGALYWSNRKDQHLLDAFIARALRDGTAAALLLTTPPRKRWTFRMRRWAGPRGPVSFIAIINALDEIQEPTAEWLETTKSMFGFSNAEARVAALIGQGLSVTLTANQLGLSPGTVRNQLKAVFSKAHVSRQVELAVLLWRI
jgi:DNA-binding CsgD family transcriptional regulator